LRSLPYEGLINRWDRCTWMAM